MPPKAASPKTGIAHNTRNADKRRPTATSAAGKSKKAKKSNQEMSKTEGKALGNKTDSSPEEPLFFVVNPKHWIDDIDPFLTSRRQDAEEKMCEYDSAEDFVFYDGVSRAMAQMAVDYCYQDRSNRDNMAVHYVLLPSFASTRRPFITVNPQEVELYKETADSNAMVKQNKTRKEAQKIVSEYNKMKEFISQQRSQEASSCPDITADLDHGNASAATVIDLTGTDTYNLHPDYDPKKVKMEPEATDTESEMSTELADTGKQDSNTATSLATIPEEHPFVPDSKPAATLHVRNPYITPVKLQKSQQKSDLSPPDPPQAERTSVTFASYHPSFTPLSDVNATPPSNTAKRSLSGILKMSTSTKAVESKNNSPKSVASVTVSAAAMSPECTQKYSKGDSGRTNQSSKTDLIARTQVTRRKGFKKEVYDTVATYFQPLLEPETFEAKHDFVPISLQFLRMTDRVPLWQLKWPIAAPIVAEFQPKFSTSALWFKSLTAVGIRNTAHGRNTAMVNRSDWKEYQAVGMISLGDLEKGETLEQVCSNLAHDVRVVLTNPKFIERYLLVLKTEINGLEKYIRGKMAEAKKNKNATCIWDDLKTSRSVIEVEDSLDALLLDEDILEIGQCVFGELSEENLWPNDVQKACFQSGLLPPDFFVT